MHVGVCYLFSNTSVEKLFINFLIKPFLTIIFKLYSVCGGSHDRVCVHNKYTVRPRGNPI